MQWRVIEAKLLCNKVVAQNHHIKQGEGKDGGGWQNCIRTAMIVLPLSLDGVMWEVGINRDYRSREKGGSIHADIRLIIVQTASAQFAKKRAYFLINFHFQ